MVLSLVAVGMTVKIVRDELPAFRRYMKMRQM
jgi:hypothetical protein